MSCPYQDSCGGCTLRSLGEPEYRRQKIAAFEAVLQRLHQTGISQGNPVFIGDSTRRRASLAFIYKRSVLTFGFNEAKSSNLVDIVSCPLLTPAINAVLPAIRNLLAEICAAGRRQKKGKKVLRQPIASGDVFICETFNGIDIVLEYDVPLELPHRMAIFEAAQNSPEIIRISHRRKVNDSAEPVVEKAKPYNQIGGHDIYIPAGTFLQPSIAGEQALTSLVLKYLGNTGGNIADLFCGVGTFSYVLASDINNKITAVDSSPELLKGFQETINKNMIPNIKILQRNLFKYPLADKELSGFDAIVFDPPRAGASAQIAEVVKLAPEGRPGKIIAVSCNPHTFVNDANALLDNGYRLQEITLVDQFTYSNHSEAVALFTKG